MCGLRIRLQTGVGQIDQMLATDQMWATSKYQAPAVKYSYVIGQYVM